VRGVRASPEGDRGVPLAEGVTRARGIETGGLAGAVSLRIAVDGEVPPAGLVGDDPPATQLVAPVHAGDVELGPQTDRRREAVDRADARVSRKMLRLDGLGAGEPLADVVRYLQSEARLRNRGDIRGQGLVSPTSSFPRGSCREAPSGSGGRE
jgi:hypothetical protein